MPSRCISCASNVETQCICTCTNQLLDEINNKKIKKKQENRTMSCSSGCRVNFSLLSVALAVASNCHAPCDRNWQGGGGVEGLLFQGFLLSFCLPLPNPPPPPLSSLFVLLRPSPKPTIFSEVGRWRHGPTHTEAGSGGYNSLWKENRGGTEGRGCIHDSKLRNQKG